VWSNLLDLKLNEEHGVPKLKKLRLIAMVFIVLACLIVVIVSPVYAVTMWDSFSDTSYSQPDNDFTGTETTVYMYGTGFAGGYPNTQYKVVYYEADIDGAGAD